MSALPAFIDRQIEAALSLGVAPYGYAAREFTCEEIGRSLYVTRRYGPEKYPSIGYFECWSVGPRGGCKLRSQTSSH